MNQSNLYPLVSFITPVFNGSQYLDELILSILNQDYPNFEHLIIDDGSTDDGQTINKLEKYPHLKWWHRENRGQYQTMNEGLEKANGGIVCFISADDLIFQNTLRKVVDFFQMNNPMHAVYGLTEYINNTGEELSIKKFVQYSKQNYYPYFAHISHSSLYIRKDFLISNQLWFNPQILLVNDYDWIIRLMKAGINLGFINQPLSIIRIHEKQISSINRLDMATQQHQIAKFHGYGGIRYFFYINILHLLNLLEQISFSYKKEKIKGVIRYLKYWYTNRLKPRIKPKNK